MKDGQKVQLRKSETDELATSLEELNRAA